MSKVIGTISKKIIKALNLDIKENTPIYIGETNIQHMINRHEEIYNIYKDHIPDIIKNPNYVYYDDKNNSICYVKSYQMGTEHINIAVRATKNNIYYAKSMYLLSTFKFERYKENGTLVKIKD